MTRATIGTGVALALVKIGCERGVASSEVAAMTGLSAEELGDPDTRMPFEDFAGLWEHLATRLDDEALPYVLARALGIESFGLMGLACLTAPTAAEALQRVVRYHRLFTDGGVLQFERDRLVWRREGPRSLGHRLIDESVIAFAVAHFRHVTGMPFNPTRVWFAHARPKTAAIAEAYFECAVTWDDGTHGFSIPKEALSAVPRLANSALSGLVEKQAEDRLGRLSEPSLTERVRRHVSASLERDPEITVVAKGLGMSERTLRRRLEEEGVSFRSLADDARRDRARALFAESHSLIDIAFELGFSEPSALARATRRWFGVSPRELRGRWR